MIGWEKEMEGKQNKDPTEKSFLQDKLPEVQVLIQAIREGNILGQKIKRPNEIENEKGQEITQMEIETLSNPTEKSRRKWKAKARKSKGKENALPYNYEAKTKKRPMEDMILVPISPKKKRMKREGDNDEAQRIVEAWKRKKHKRENREEV